MRFDTNSQMWVDESGRPLLIQPPKPTTSSNVPDFSNFNTPTPNPYVPMFNGQSFDFSTPDLNFTTGNNLAPMDMTTIDKSRLSQLSNYNQGLMDITRPIQDMDTSLMTPEQMYNEQTGGQTGGQNSTLNQNNKSGNALFSALNNAGKTYSLESSLYGLGSALGKKDYKGMTTQEINRSKNNDLLSGIGNAGKLLTGGARTLLSGASAAHMNNWNINEYKTKRRDALVNNQTGADTAYAAIGGAPIYGQDGGEVLLPPPISAELEGNPNRVYDFRNSLPETSTSSEVNSPAMMSRLTGRPYGFDFNTNVTNEAINQAAMLLAESRRTQPVQNTSTTSVVDTPSDVSGYDNLDFKTAFNKAYEDKGDGQVFSWQGKSYLLSKAASSKKSNSVRTATNSKQVLDDSDTNVVSKTQQKKLEQKVNILKSTKPGTPEFEKVRNSIFQDLGKLDEQDRERGARRYEDPIGESVFDMMTFGVPRLGLGLTKMVESGGKDGKMDAAMGAVNMIPLAGKLFSAPTKAIGILNGTNKSTEVMSGVNIGNNATKTKMAQYLVDMAKNSKSPLTSKQSEMVNVAENFLKGTSSGTKELPGIGRVFGKKPDLTGLYLGGKVLEGTQRKKKYQDGGEVTDDVLMQLQAAVDSGEMTQEDAEMFLQQGQQDASQEAGVPQEQDVQAQLMQAVQNGEISEEEAMSYLQEMQGQSQPQISPEQAQGQQPQISPEQAQQELALAVQNGEMSEEEAQTYLQQLYGEVDVNSRPLEPYTGEVREGISPEQYLTGEYTTGDENKPHNAEVEKGEYINRNGITQQVVGDKHSKGGEKMNLEAGTIIITDKGRIGANNAKALSLQTGLKLKAGDTYSQVVDIFTKKIGLDKLNKEQESLFKNLEKVGSQGNQTTQDLNNSFLNAKINAIEENKKQLLSQREQLVQVLFQLQEQSKDKAVSNEALEKFEAGGEVDPCANLTGEARVQCVLKNYKAPTPAGSYGQLDTERQQIVPFLNEMGVETPSDLDTYDQQQLGLLAGKAQQATNDYVSGHYGLYEAPTQSGLQWLVDKGHLKGNEAFLKDIYKNGKITRGSYDTLNAEGKKVVADLVEGLDPKTQAEYGKSSYRDNAWYYRNPIVRNVDFDNEDEYNKAKSAYDSLGDDNHYYSGSKGLYLKFNLKKPEEVIAAKAPSVDKPKDSPLNVNQSKKRNNAFLLPDQSTLPPEGLRAVPKYDIRYNYLDNIKISPEQNLTENYRSYDEARGKMEGLPDVMNQANLAMLSGNVAQANNQAINQINAQNAQMAQQVAQANLGVLNRQAEMDLKLSDQYDERMNRALDITRKDLEGYYDFNRKVNVGEFNTRHQLSLLNDLFNNYGVNPDGTVAFDPKTTSEYKVDQADAIKWRQFMEDSKKKSQASVKKEATKNKVTSNWGK